MLSLFPRRTFFSQCFLRSLGSAAFIQNTHKKDCIRVNDICTIKNSFTFSRSFHRWPPLLSDKQLSELDFERICDETLESLCDFFEALLDEHGNLKGADVTYLDGVLTVSLGENGTYVINRQTPNKQIWLSSPKSGPKRYDLIEKKAWIYKHDQKSLHSLLQEELSELLRTDIKLSKCLYSTL
uniref:ferroxidase n=1 Tax=Riptortus pedestris TaxID=329032 RepID=R4WU11_RIPPE|nr:frataxin, putative [Riptortus pedestris]